MIATDSAPVSPAAAAPWRLRLLGAVELRSPAGLPVRLPTRAVALLLARLALPPLRQHPREELIELLWPGADPPTARNRLRQALSVLRSLLQTPTLTLPLAAASGPAGDELDGPHSLQADRRAVWLAADALTSDLQAFTAAVARKDWPSALSHYQGEFLPGYFDEWVLEERAHFVAAAERAQGTWALLQAAAPEPAVVAPEAALGADARLPRYLTRLIGFEAEGAALGHQVLQHRLVVLRGPGGAGKTRLAVEVAWSLAQRSEARGAAGGPTAPAFDLVAFVPLASCTTSTQMVDTLMHVMRKQGGAEGADTTAQVVAALDGRRVLLVLDNFEQLVDVASADVTRWLSALPLLHVLVTSRHALETGSEQELVLRSLPLPPIEGGNEPAATSAAVSLFADRARAARADFVLDEVSTPRVGVIVRALHGLPLAIELAAARLRSLDLDALHQMLLQPTDTGGSLSLLARRGTRGPDDGRHASMLRVLQGSWQMLNPQEQQLLAALAVCEGGASLGLVAFMAPGAPARPAHAALQLDELVAASVVYNRAAGPDSGEPGPSRYQVYEPMREFVFMQAGEAGLAALRGQHAAAVSRWAGALAGDLNGRAELQRATQALAIARAEWGNLMRALQSGADPAIVEARPEQALDTVLCLRNLLEDLCLPASALADLRRAAELAAPGYREGPVQSLLASHSFEAGEREAAAAHALRAAQANTTPQERGPTLRGAARVLLRLGHSLDEVEPMAEAAVESARAQGDWPTLALALATRSVVRLRRTRDLQANLVLHTEVVQVLRQHGPSIGLASGLVGLALALGFLHRVPEQLVLLDEVRDRAARAGQDRLLAFGHSVTGYALADQRRFAESAGHYLRCLQLTWNRAAWREWFYGVWNLPRTLAHLRRPGPAAQLMGFAEAFYAQRFGVLGFEDLPEARRTRRLAAAQLGADEADRHWQQGAALGMVQAMQLAVSECAAFGAAIPREPGSSP